MGKKRRCEPFFAVLSLLLAKNGHQSMSRRHRPWFTNSVRPLLVFATLFPVFETPIKSITNFLRESKTRVP